LKGRNVTPQPIVNTHLDFCEIIINDILTNAVRYSAPDQQYLEESFTFQPRVVIEIIKTESAFVFTCENSSKIHPDAITIFETGQVPKDSDLTSCLGLRLIRHYCDYLKYPTEILDGKNSTIFKISFPYEEI
ncbi:MAG: hypothetical protein AAFY76_22540, partial [Cyanobacteria bacterium J06649_11]